MITSPYEAKVEHFSGNLNSKGQIVTHNLFLPEPQNWCTAHVQSMADRSLWTLDEFIFLAACCFYINKLLSEFC